jgi:hypothetical protein
MNNPVRLFNLGSPEVVQSLLESESPPPNPLPLETVMNTERQPPSPVMNMEPAFLVINTEPGPSVVENHHGGDVDLYCCKHYMLAIDTTKKL